MDERLRHPIEKRLRPDEAVIGQHVRPARHMLAAAEADLEMERTITAKQSLSGDGAFRWHRDLRQERIDQPLLTRTQRLALGAAIEAVDGERIARLVRSHGAS